MLLLIKMKSDKDILTFSPLTLILNEVKKNIFTHLHKSECQFMVIREEKKPAVRERERAIKKKKREIEALSSSFAKQIL